MLERRSALDDHPVPQQSDGAAPVTIAPLTPAAVAMVTAFPSSERSVRGALKSVTGLAAPRIGWLAEEAGATVAALSPGRYLVLSASADLPDVLRSAIAAKAGAVTDLGHARTILRISGESSERLLMSGIMLDLSLAAFPAGSVAQTVLHHMDVTLLRRSPDAFDISVFRGFAVSLAGWLIDAAATTGFVLGPAD